MAKIDIIAEQTEFLLERQKEVQAFFKGEFQSLFSAVEAEQKKAEQVNAGPELNSFQNVLNMLHQQEEETIEMLGEDISFLEEQLGAIKKIQELPDEGHKDELTNMLLQPENEEDKTELVETNQFKADVEAECAEAKDGFGKMIAEIKDVLLEEGVKELEVLLEAHAAAQAEEAEEGEEGEGLGCCGGTTSCGGTCSDDECDEEEGCDESACASCPGCNIFQGVEEKVDTSSEDSQ